MTGARTFRVAFARSMRALMHLADEAGVQPAQRRWIASTALAYGARGLRIEPRDREVALLGLTSRLGFTVPAAIGRRVFAILDHQHRTAAVVLDDVPEVLSDHQAGDLDLLAAVHDLRWRVGPTWPIAPALDGFVEPQLRHAVHLERDDQPVRAQRVVDHATALELAGPIVERFGLRLRAP
jgi:hypothetical protein